MTTPKIRVQNQFLNSLNCKETLDTSMNCRRFFRGELPSWKFHGSNQGTYGSSSLVVEGQWVPEKDVLADNSSSQQGELAIGQNILVGYTLGRL
jgi:DNA-directed RNA polymerase beta subunit